MAISGKCAGNPEEIKQIFLTEAVQVRARIMDIYLSPLSSPPHSIESLRGGIFLSQSTVSIFRHTSGADFESLVHIPAE